MYVHVLHMRMWIQRGGGRLPYPYLKKKKRKKKVPSRVPTQYLFCLTIYSWCLFLFFLPLPIKHPEYMMCSCVAQNSALSHACLWSNYASRVCQSTARGYGKSETVTEWVMRERKKERKNNLPVQYSLAALCNLTTTPPDFSLDLSCQTWAS